MSLRDSLNLNNLDAKKIYKYQSSYAAKYSKIVLRKRFESKKTQREMAHCLNISLSLYKEYERRSLDIDIKDYEQIVNLISSVP